MWERNQSRLLDLVETLTARIVELSTSGGGGSGSLEAEKLRAKAASPASSSPSAPPSMPEVKAESTAKVKAESMPQVKAEPKPILGGRSPALDILDAIEEVNRRMFGSNGRRQEVPKQEGSTPQASEKAEEETAPVNEIADVEVVDTSKVWKPCDVWAH